MGHLFSMAKSVTNRSIYQWTSTWWDGLGMAREELFVAPPLLDADDWVVGRPTNWWLVKVVFLAGLSKSYPVYLDGNMNKYTCIYIYWLVVLEHVFSIYWEESSQLTNSYFSEGWLNHQPEEDWPQRCGQTHWWRAVWSLSFCHW